LGVGLVTLANNHVLDYGPEVLAQTLGILKEKQIQWAGLNMQQDLPQEPALVTLKGQRLAFLGFCSVCPAGFDSRGKAPGVAVALPSVMLPALKRAQSLAQGVVVLPHWGQEYFGVNALQAKLAQELANAGAAAVLGSHSHVLQKSQWLGKTWVAYGLGNFIFDLSYPVTLDSAILFLDFNNGKVEAGHWVPITLSSGRPEPMDEEVMQSRRIRYQIGHGVEFGGQKLLWPGWKE
jgi:poly-gamma-glutamate capsule biosynthesis protein CapA/YwtB (metallophosphatase superfamily)